MRVALAAVLLLAGCDGVFKLTSVDPPGDASGDGLADGAFQDGLVAYYPMDDLTGNTIDDASGMGNAATCVTAACPAVVPGTLGNAYSFDGINDLVEVASSMSLLTTSAYTVATWLRIDQLQTGVACPFGKLQGTTGNNSWQLCVSNQGQLLHYTSDPTGTTITGTLTTGAWHHVAIVWDGLTASIWLDGVRGGTHDTSAISFDDGEVTIGGDLDSGARTAMFGGLLDDLRIYDRALPSSEIATLATPP